MLCLLLNLPAIFLLSRIADLKWLRRLRDQLRSRPIQEGAFMCRKCDEIAEAIVRYRRLKGQVTDQQMIEATVLLLDKLEAEKLALHPKE